MVKGYGRNIKATEGQEELFGNKKLIGNLKYKIHELSRK